MMRNLAAAALGLWVAHPASPGTVTLQFGLDDLVYRQTTVRYQQDRDGDITDQPTDQGVVNIGDDLPGFDESLHGRLERVVVSFDYNLSGAAFAIIDDPLRFADPMALVTGRFRVSEDVFVTAFTPESPTLLDRPRSTEEFAVSSVGCEVSEVDKNCVTRDAISLSSKGPIVFAYSGADLDAFRFPHRIGLIVQAEILEFSSNVEAFRTGLFTDPTNSPFFDSEVRYTITYQTAPIPLPASGVLLAGGALGLLALRRRRRAR